MISLSTEVVRSQPKSRQANEDRADEGPNTTTFGDLLKAQDSEK